MPPCSNRGPTSVPDSLIFITDPDPRICNPELWIQIQEGNYYGFGRIRNLLKIDVAIGKNMMSNRV